MTSKHVIRESESPRTNGLVDSDFTNDAFLGHYPIRKYTLAFSVNDNKTVEINGHRWQFYNTYSYYEIDGIKICTNVYLMGLVHNRCET